MERCNRGCVQMVLQQCEVSNPTVTGIHCIIYNKDLASETLSASLHANLETISKSQLLQKVTAGLNT